MSFRTDPFTTILWLLYHCQTGLQFLAIYSSQTSLSLTFYLPTLSKLRVTITMVLEWAWLVPWNLRYAYGVQICMVSEIWLNDPYLHIAWACTGTVTMHDWLIWLGVVDRCVQSKGVICSAHDPYQVIRSEDSSHFYHLRHLESSDHSFRRLHLEIWQFLWTMTMTNGAIWDATAKFISCLFPAVIIWQVNLFLTPMVGDVTVDSGY